MATKRRTKADTVASAVNIAQALQNKGATLCWPEHLVKRSSDPAMAEAELEIYELGLKRRSPDQWDGLDLIALARFASTLTQTLHDEEQLKRSGSLIQSPNNPKQVIRNPLLDVVSTRLNHSDKLASRVGFVVDDARTLARGGKTSSAIEGAFKKADSNSLLA
jgi:hypothetical protein